MSPALLSTDLRAACAWRTAVGRWLLCLAAVCWWMGVVAVCPRPVTAQTAEAPGPPQPTPGGGGTTDFTQLMTLIQQTIDPNAWIDASSSMVPFPAGVFVDPAAQLPRVRSAASAIRGGEPTRGERTHDEPTKEWTQASTLRQVSLQRLDRALPQLMSADAQVVVEHALLAGLQQIEAVQVDLAHRDVILIGPAGSHAGGAGAAFQLADVAVLLARTTRHGRPFGCSIDPTDQGILAAQALLQPAGARQRLAADPPKFVSRMNDALGPHRVRVFGLPAGSPTASALVTADQHMKQLGFGTSATSVGLETYFQHLDSHSAVALQSLIRWWFTYAAEPVQATADGLSFQLPSNCVQLLSEQEWVSQFGRQATGNRDRAADAFASGMTAAMPDLRRVHAEYARLCGIFETALALQLALEAGGQPDLQSWFPNLYRLGMAEGRGETPLDSVDGLTAWHRHVSGSVVAVVSGGVHVHPQRLAQPEAWRRVPHRSSRLLAASPNPLQDSVWWWD